MSQTWVLGQRALREAWRTPEAILPTLFIPLFFLVVNIGQAGKIFPSESTEFLKGQGYGAFQLPASLLLAASFGTAALYLVEDIEGGYFDKLRAAPVSRSALVLGRLVAEFAKGIVISIAIIALGMVFGVTIASGPLGFLLLVLLTASWAVVFVGLLQLIALKTRSAAATNSAGLIFFPLMFLTPNFVPRDLLTRPMEIAASINPVTYLMESLRSLILDDLAWAHDPAGLRGRRRRRGDHARRERAADQPLRLSHKSETGARRGLDQGTHDGGVLGAVREDLGVPLHAEEEAGAGIEDRFDRPVRRVRDHFEAAAEVVDRLVVEGVDGEPAAARDAVQRRAGRQGDGVGRLVRRVGLAVVRDVLVQRPATGDVQRLHAAADGEHRQVALTRGLVQAQLVVVGGAVDVRAQLRARRPGRRCPDRGRGRR